MRDNEKFRTPSETAVVVRTNIKRHHLKHVCHIHSNGALMRLNCHIQLLNVLVVPFLVFFCANMLRLFSSRTIPFITTRLATPSISLHQRAYAAIMTSHFTNEQLNIKNLFDVSKLKCVVTGGGTGIGLMCTQALVANGATVYITGRREEKLDNVVSKYSGPGKIIAISADITKKDECLRLAQEVGEKEPNGIHLLVNNAGIARDDNTKLSSNPPESWEDADALSKHMLQSDPQAWAETFETNVTSQFFVAAAFTPLLAKANNNAYEPFKGIKYTSSIIYISSISGLMKGSSSAQFAYANSKAAVKQQVFHVGTHLQGTGIRVNQIAPGVFPSESKHTPLQIMRLLIT